jgi:hypothetical protein
VPQTLDQTRIAQPDSQAELLDLESVSTFVVGRPNITQFPESPNRRPPYLAADAFVLMVGELHRQQFWTRPVQPPGYGGVSLLQRGF